jgi:hypothetical protein
VASRKFSTSVIALFGLRDQAAEPEDHAALVLAQDPDRGREEDQQEDRDDPDHD